MIGEQQCNVRFCCDGAAVARDALELQGNGRECE